MTDDSKLMAKFIGAVCGIGSVVMLGIVLLTMAFPWDPPKYPEPQPWSKEQVDQYCEEMFAAGLTAHEWYTTFYESNRLSEIPVVFGCIYEKLAE